MNLVEPSLRRPFTILVAVAGMVLGAILALRQMPRDIFPSLGVPTVYVAQPFGGMDPAQMEGYLTYYYEYHFLYITGIEHVESKSIQGAALIKLQFHPGTDMSQAMSETVAYVNRARAFMPPGTVPPFVMRFDTGSIPVGDLVFSSESRTVGQLQDAALNLVRPLFATLPGVSAPPPFGGSARSIVVNLKLDRLRAYHLTPDDIVSAMTAANTISPSGNVTLGDMYPMVLMNSVVKNIKDLESVPIRVGTYPAVYLRDVGEISDASDIVTSFALVNGHRTVYIPVTKRADASTLSVVELVKRSLPEFQRVLPDDVKVTYEFDQSHCVTHAISGLVKEGLLGAVLTGLMVLLFLRDWRSALIVVITIPLSLLGAVFALWITHQTVNIMTLGGLALAVGVLVDEATVTIENIHTHLSRGEVLAVAALDATSETAIPRFLAMLCILAVFIPAFSMAGVAKALFVPLALAVGFSMICSFLLSSSLVPILSIWFLGQRAAGAAAKLGEIHESATRSKFQNGFATFSQRLLRMRRVVMISYLGIGGLVIFLVSRQLGTEIFPRVDSGQFQLRLRAPAGSRIEVTERIATNALAIIRREAGPENYDVSLGFVGVHASSYPINLIHLWNSGPEEAVMQVQLKPNAPVRMERLKERLRKILGQEMPAVKFSFEPSDLISRVMSLGSPTPIEVAVSGPNLAVNLAHAQKIREQLLKVPSLRDIQFGQTLDYPTIDIGLNRERAGLMGVKMSEATHSIVEATSSSRFTVPNYWADPNSGVSYQLQVQVPQARMNSLEEIKNIPINGAGPVLLRNIASVTNGLTIGEYDRYNMQRVITVTANISGADLGSVSTHVRQAIKMAGESPPKVTVNLRGQIVPLEQLLAGLHRGLILAVVVIFLLLAATFQSFKLSLIIISTAPAVVAGVAVALWVTGTTLNIQSFMGAIMAIGVAVANAILLVTFAERSRLSGMPSDAAAIEGVRSRLRPILMTSVAMIAGMMPMAIGLGEAGEQSAPLGRAVIGGLCAATLSTLVILPSIFAIVQKRSRIQSASLSPKDPSSAYFRRD